MKKFISFHLMLLLNSCTFSMNYIPIEGNATDIVDTPISTPISASLPLL